MDAYKHMQDLWHESTPAFFVFALTYMEALGRPPNHLSYTNGRSCLHENGALETLEDYSRKK
ncbi:hypothetical protein V3C99_000454 [Haemonchus contortus]